MKQIKMERQFLNADADKLEEEKFRGLATGIVRSTKEKQVRDRAGGIDCAKCGNGCRDN